MAEKPISISYEAKAKVVITGVPDGSGNDPSIIVPRILPGATLSQDIFNQMAVSFTFDIENAVQYFDQSATFNPLQHGSEVVVYFNDISGGILLDPLPDADGWIKKATLNIIDPDATAASATRGMAFLAVDKLWAVVNQRTKIIKGTPTVPVVAHLTPLDENNLVYQVIDKSGDAILDLDEESIPIVTRFVKTAASPFSNPLPAGKQEVIPPNDFDINSELGRILFKKSQDVGIDDHIFGYNVTAHKFSTTLAAYELEDILQDLLETSIDFGGPALVFGTDFDFFDPNDNSRFTFGSTNFNVVGSSAVNDTITVTGAFTSYFVAGVLFRAVNTSPDINGSYTVVSSLAAGPNTVITVEEDVTQDNAIGNLERYFGTAIKASRINWQEDSGIGSDFIQMLRDSGVMPFNYFLHADENNFIRGEFILQKSSPDRSISRILFANFPNSFNDIFTQVKVVSHGGTYPKKLFDPDNVSDVLFNFGRVISQPAPFALPLGVGQIVAQKNEGVDGFIDAWERFGDLDFRNVWDDTVLTYVGFADAGWYKFTDEFTEDDEFFYPFPNVLNVTPQGQDDVILFDAQVETPQDIDKIILQMYFPPVTQQQGSDKDWRPALYIDGNADRPYDSSQTILDNTFDGVWSVFQLPLMSVTFGLEGEDPIRGLGPDSIGFTMDPTKSDTKIIKVDKGEKIKSLRLTFHRPFVCETQGRRVAIYMINTFQAYDRGTIFIPGLDVNGDKRLPFARITGTSTDSSLIGESGTVASVIDNANFTALNGTLEDYRGVFLVVPSPTGGSEPYISEILFNDRDAPVAGTQTINLQVISQKPHTDLTLAGVQAGDTWYLMHNRFWLDLLFNRVDLFKEKLFRKMQAVGLPYKTQMEEIPEILDLATCLRVATTKLSESISNFDGIAVSLAYRPDYSVGLTVDEPLFQTPNYFVTALDQVIEESTITINAKLINFDQNLDG